MKAQELLFQLQDKGYRDFQSKLIPTIPVETIIGVRIPTIRKLAKEYGKDPESVEFLKQLPHSYYDENILHALLVAEIKDYEVCVKKWSASCLMWIIGRCVIFFPKGVPQKQRQTHRQNKRMDSFGPSLYLPLRNGNADDTFPG